MNHMCLLFSGPVRTLLGVLLCVGLCAAPAPAAQLAQDAPKRVLVLPFSVQTPNAPAHLQSGLASVLASRLAAHAGIVATAQDRIAKQVQQALKNRNFTAVGSLLADSGADYLVISTLGPGATRQDEVASYLFARGGAAPKKLSRLLADVNDPLAAVEELAVDIGSVIEGRPGAGASPEAAPPVSDNPERAWRRGMLADSMAGLSNQSGGYQLVESLRGLPIGLETLDFNIGDVDGDGEQDLVILARKSLEVYRYDQGRFTRKFSQPLPGYLHYLALSLVDANKNGVPELYVGASNGNLASSAIWEWQDGKLLCLEDRIPYYLNAFAMPDGSAMLLGQTPPPGRAAGGAIALMRYEKNGLAPSGRNLPLPMGYNVYDIAPVDLDGDDKLEIVAINGRNRLQVFKGGELVWTSADEYGASRHFYGTVSAVAKAETEPDYLHTRIVVADPDQDGVPEVLVGKNKVVTVPYLTSIRYFDGSSLSALRWEGNGLRVLWETRPMPGYTAGYQVLPDRSDPLRVQLFVAETDNVSPLQLWSSPKTTLHRLVLAQ